MKMTAEKMFCRAMTAKFRISIRYYHYTMTEKSCQYSAAIRISDGRYGFLKKISPFCTIFLKIQVLVYVEQKNEKNFIA